MDIEQQQHLQELYKTFQKRLRILEQQSAVQGLRTPPETIIEIEELQLKISTIEKQIANYNNKTADIKQIPAIRTDYSSNPQSLNVVLPLACPNCLQIDAVRKVSALVRDGTIITTRKIISEDRTATERTTSKSNLAELLSPPLPPREPLFASIRGYLLVFLAMASVTSIIFVVKNLFSSNKQSLFDLLILTSLELLIILLVFYYTKSFRSKLKNQLEIRMEDYRQVLQKWNNLYYCARCDILYLKNHTEAVFPDDMKELLYKQ